MELGASNQRCQAPVGLVTNIERGSVEEQRVSMEEEGQEEGTKCTNVCVNAPRHAAPRRAAPCCCAANCSVAFGTRMHCGGSG